MSLLLVPGTDVVLHQSVMTKNPKCKCNDAGKTELLITSDFFVLGMPKQDASHLMMYLQSKVYHLPKRKI